MTGVIIAACVGAVAAVSAIVFQVVRTARMERESMER